MPWIEVVGLEGAQDALRREYESALKRAGRIWNIVSIMSQNPRAMKTSMDFYSALMFGRSPLSRSQREMLAVVVSVVNQCIYWIRAHAHDLRAEVGQDMGLTDEATADKFVHQIANDWREANLSPSDQALCAYAEKLTLYPDKMVEADVAGLRGHGFDDRAIHDATQIIGYFNYINRIADALGVDYEDFIRPWEEIK